MKKIAILVISVIVFLVTFSYLSIPSLFNNGHSVWREYVDYDDKTNFDSVSFDLWRKISEKEVVLNSKVPFLVLNDEKVSFEFYSVDRIDVEYSWPHEYFFGRTGLMGDIPYYTYCIVAIEEDIVQSKQCLTSMINPNEFVKSEDNAFIEFYATGYNERKFSLREVDELTIDSEYSIVTDEEYRRINKRRVTCGYEHIIWMDFESYPIE